MDQPSFAHDALPGGIDDFLLEEEIQRDRELLAVEVPLMRERRLKHLERRAQRAAAEPERPRRPPPRSSGYYIALLASGMPKSERLRQAAATVRAVVTDDGAPLPVPVPVTVAGAERAAPSAATAAKVAAATVPPPEPLSTFLSQLPFLPSQPQLRDQAVKLAEAQAERRAALEQFRAGLLADEAKARRLEAARRAADRPASIATPKAEPVAIAVANGAAIAEPAANSAANGAAIAKPAEAPEPAPAPAPVDEAKLRQQVQEFQARRGRLGRPSLDQDPRVQELLTRVERKRRPVPIEATPTPRRRR
jgi:hypothetical protein